MPEHQHWRPVVGEWVTYDPGGGAPTEDGEVTEVVNETSVRVRYRGEQTAKLTRVVDLRPGRPSSAWH